jgi:Fur family ferric uptake transcriptional regulator
MLSETLLRMTKQRQTILEELMSVTSHPTADDMYEMVRKRLPHISLGTVYRNLEILSDEGVIQKLNVGGSKKRFDGNTMTHYHLRCLQCGRVDDFDMTPFKGVEEKAAALSGYSAASHSLEVSGICPDCQN